MQSIEEETEDEEPGGEEEIAAEDELRAEEGADLPSYWSSGRVLNMSEQNRQRADTLPYGGPWCVDRGVRSGDLCRRSR